MSFPLDKFKELPTPFYYYDLALLTRTIETMKASMRSDYCMHYAVKACANSHVLRTIAELGLGADCVSGGEIMACRNYGFPADKIVFAGVGKADWEIELALREGIFCFNVESLPELEVICELASKANKVGRVALRINPNVGAHTHANIVTGLAENKFGIDMQDMERVIATAQAMPNVQLIGLHFHIGSQILQMDDFEALCHRINELQEKLNARGIALTDINVGGGLGIDYECPDEHPVPNFKAYFSTFGRHLKLLQGQRLHFELGRSIVGQCGSLITRVLYVKENAMKKFCIVDAGMTDLIRPALYDALHQIQNLSSDEPSEPYDVVGPICESSDVFAKAYSIPHAHRGDLLALRSAGAYGEIMASQYNCRALPRSYTDDTMN